MVAPTSFLPKPRQTLLTPRSQQIVQRPSSNDKALTTKQNIPPYGARKGWIPRTLDDFGDGGAYPEIHVAQYPLEMGRESGSSSVSRTVPISLDGQGRIKYESILAPGSNMQIQARHEDLVGAKVEDDDLRRPDPEEEAKTALETKQALEKLVNTRIAAAQPGIANAGSNKDVQFIKYTPVSQGQSNNAPQQRIIRLTETAVDPLEPSKFRINKKVPKGPPSPPVPVMHSPPRKLSAKDQQDWKIPPCISNWKNNKGYTISLDKRLAADGRGLQELTPNDNFAKIAEALYIAEQTAREEVEKRAEIDRLIKLKEKEKKEEMLRRLAQEARMERTATAVDEDAGLDEDTIQARDERDKIRRERQRDRERDLRMERNRSAAARNADRDMSERIALGQAVPQASSETMYDQRLFNQTQGLDQGFGDEDSYNIYSKPLFHGSSANVIYRPKKNEEDFGGEDDMKKLMNTSKFRPDKEFSGVDREKVKEGQQRSAPVEFEKDEADPFGLDAFLSQAKTTSKALDKIGTQGTMHATGGNANSAELAEGGGSKRSRIAFDSSSSSRDSKRR